MTEKDEELFRNKNVYRFFEIKIFSDNVKGYDHLTGEYRGPSQNKCTKNLTQKQNNFIPFVIQSFLNYDGHPSSEKN